MQHIQIAGRLGAAIPVLVLWTGSCLAQCALVFDMTPGNAANNNTAFLTAAFGQELYFAQTTASHGTELWKWSAATGVALVSDIAPGLSSSNPQQMRACCTPYGPRLFFSASEAGHGHELYTSDGTGPGTARLLEIRPGSGSSLPQKFVECGDRVFFQANDGVTGDELWLTDGSAAGTSLVRDIAPGAGHGRPTDLVALGGKVLFSANDGSTGRELWCSDGTAAGTTMVLDVWPGAGSAEVGQLTRVGDIVYFRAVTAAHGAELWRTDGTAAGTFQVVDLFPGVSWADPVSLRACGGKLFFRGSASPSTSGLWVTDGTAAGTTFLGGGAEEITCSGARVFFQRSGVGTGAELWVSDGTPAGTNMVADLRPGALGSAPYRLIDGGGGVFFVASTVAVGELWFSDGTAAGTVRQCTLDPVNGQAPYELTMCRGRLFFVAHDPAVGNELFGIATPGATSAVLGTGARPDHVTLAVRDGAVPVFGSTIEVVGHGPAGQLAMLFGGPAQPPVPVPTVPGLIDGGSDWTGLLGGQAVGFGLALSPDPAFLLTVPNDLSLEGQPFHFQALWWSPTAATPFQLGNALQLVAGPALPH